MTIHDIIGGKLIIQNDLVKFVADKSEKQDFKTKKTFSQMTAYFKRLECEGKILIHQIMSEIDPLYIFKKDSELLAAFDVVWERGKLKFNGKKN